LATQYFSNIERGLINEGYRNENLEKLTFPDKTIDLHVTQDVFENILNPSFAFREINRTLKSGGCHIFTVPLVNKHSPTEIRAELRNGQIHHLKPESFHGNPILDGKSLVVTDWGYDFVEKPFFIDW
jgi:SAM-dependent methyltransferase